MACYSSAMGTKRQLIIWESEVTREADGTARVVAKRPHYRMTIAEAAKLLGCTPWTVSRLYQEGVLTGCKPGADPTKKRKDGRASNAKVVLDAESVLRHKAVAGTMVSAGLERI